MLFGRDTFGPLKKRPRPTLTVAVCFFLLHGLLTVSRADQITAVPIDGQPISGEFVSISERGVQIANKTDNLGAEQLLQVRFHNKPLDQSSKRLQVGLIGGSNLATDKIAGRDDQWVAQSPAIGEVRIPRGELEWVLFRTPTNKEDEAWRTALRENRSADELVISRGQDATDRISGVIQSIETDNVQFEFNGQSMQAPRSRLLGAIWYRRKPERMQPTIGVHLVDGSIWLATKLSTVSDRNAMRIEWSTAQGTQVSCRLEHILEIDFSVANLRWLADVPPIESKIPNRIELATPLAARQRMLSPRFVSSSATTSSALKDLTFPGPGEITFRVPAGFRRFETKVRRGETGEVRSPLQIQVWQDDRKLADLSLPAEQVEAIVSVEVAPEKRLRLVVDAEAPLMAGTEVKWIQPRLLR